MHSIETIARNQRNFINGIGRPITFFELGDVDRLFADPRTLPFVKNTDGWRLASSIQVKYREPLDFVRSYLLDLAKDTDYGYGIVDAGYDYFTIGVYSRGPKTGKRVLTDEEFLEGVDPRVPSVGSI